MLREAHRRRIGLEMGEERKRDRASHVGCRHVIATMSLLSDAISALTGFDSLLAGINIPAWRTNTQVSLVKSRRMV